MTTKVALCLVDQEEKVQAILRELKNNGFSKQEISILHPETGIRRVDRERQAEYSQHWFKNLYLTEVCAMNGATVGAIIGAILGLLASFRMVSIPGIGPFMATGPAGSALSSVLSGSTLCGGIGLIVGALISIGLDKTGIVMYEEFIKSGNTIIAVEVDTEIMLKSALRTYEDAGASEIYPKNLFLHS
ncbi:MAG: hypothetical protein QRY74_06230 [Chlamydia sp.]